MFSSMDENLNLGIYVLFDDFDSTSQSSELHELDPFEIMMVHEFAHVDVSLWRGA